MLAVKITATWHRALYSPSRLEAVTQCSSLWMSHCREKSGMAPTAACNTVLRYQESPVLLSCGFLQASPQLLQQHMRRVPTGWPLSLILQPEEDSYSRCAFRPSSSHCQIHQIFHPTVHPVSPKLHRQSSSSSSWGVHRYLCHLRFRVRRQRRVPYMSSVQYNGTLWSEITENNPHWQSTETIQLVWLWDNAVIPQCHLTD